MTNKSSTTKINLDCIKQDINFPKQPMSPQGAVNEL